MILFGGDAGVLSLNTSKNILLNNNFYSTEIQYNATNINDVKFNVEITIENNEKKIFEVPLSSIVSGLSGNLYLKKEETRLNTFSAISSYVKEIEISGNLLDNYILNGILLLSGTLDNSFDTTEINNKAITANINLVGNIIDNDNNTYICQIVPNIDNEIPTVNLQLSDNNISYMNNAIINSNGTLSYNNNFDICINSLSGTSGTTTNYSFNGSIYNFPESNLYDNYKPLLSLENSSMINLSPQLINNGDIIDWTNSNHNQIIGEVNNQYINNIADNYKNDKNIILNISNNNDLNKVSDILNSLPKNLYKHDIYIFINNTDTYNLSSALIIENFYNGKINIIGNNRPTLTSAKHTVFAIHNIEEITIENIEFTNDTISGAISDATYSAFDACEADNSIQVTDGNIDKFHMTLLSLDSVNSAKVSNCTFDNKVARKIKNINLTIYENNVLSYATYSLVFNKFSNLILNNCSFKNSNIGVITYLNALTQYTGKTYIYFPGINADYNFTYIKTNKAIYGENITNTNNTNNTNFKSIVNYSAGNSIVVMFPLSSVYMGYEINNTINYDISLSNSLLLSEPNLILGIAQVGSLFNHTHEGITSTRLDLDDLDRYKKRLEQLRKFKYDTCIGMINPQYAGNLFECNDTKKSIGFQYLTDELENNVITYGQYTHNLNINGTKLNINGTNFDGESIHQTPSGTAGNILVLDLGDRNSYPTGIVGEQFNNISAEPSAGYYNAGTFWHKYLNDKEVHYDLINVTSANTEEFIRNLCSRSTENLYLTQLLKYYFSTNQSFESPLSALHEQTNISAMPIGLWSHPSMYQLKFNEENPFDSQLIHDTTIRISDRYNHAIRNKYWINGRSYDSYWGNANKVVKYPFAANYLICSRSYYFL